MSSVVTVTSTTRSQIDLEVRNILQITLYIKRSSLSLNISYNVIPSIHILKSNNPTHLTSVHDSFTFQLPLYIYIPCATNKQDQERELVLLMSQDGSPFHHATKLQPLKPPKVCFRTISIFSFLNMLFYVLNLIFIILFKTETNLSGNCSEQLYVTGNGCHFPICSLAVFCPSYRGRF